MARENPAFVDCPLCGSPMVERDCKYGTFLGCSRWPECFGKRSTADAWKEVRRAKTVKKRRKRPDKHSERPERERKSTGKEMTS